ncbi:MAG: glycosyltransferase family 39 protein [Anaerolineales bacterium]|nr:glycosyltransferase family 39 protein [Anaerolineales bacterium]
MKLRVYCVLFLAGLLLGILAAVWIRVPGYMDASYYYTTSMQLAQGKGFSEPYIWNYLGDPAGIPHPSHLYWMPLASIISSIPLRIGPPEFRTAQVVFVVLAALIPVLTCMIAYSLSGSSKTAKRAGFLALAPGFFLPNLVTTDNFTIYALAGSIALWLMAESANRTNAGMWAATGAVIGVCHLSRTDGLLFLIPAFVLLIRSQYRVRSLLGLLLGYLLVMAPWWLRNLSVSGSLLGGASSGMLFMMDYNELFRYPDDPLTVSAWIEAGFMKVAGIRLKAAWSNLMSLIAVNGLIILAPFIVLGGLHARNRKLVKAAVVYLVVLFGVMSFVFPQAGFRGGFFHSSAALLAVGWALASIGFEKMIDWGIQKRGWQQQRAVVLFGGVIVAVIFFLTGWNYYVKVIGKSGVQPVWQASAELYNEAGCFIRQHEDEGIMAAVKDPPSFYAAAGIPAVVIPDGDLHTLQRVVERYAVRWIVLDNDHPDGLAALYDNPELTDWLQLYAHLLDGNEYDVYIFRVLEGEMNEP